MLAIYVIPQHFSAFSLSCHSLTESFNLCISFWNLSWSSALTRAQQLLRWATVWPQYTWAEKWGAAVPLSGGAGSPSNTMWPVPSSISVPSGILIHPAVRPLHRPKIGGYTPFGRGAGSPSNTMSTGPGLPPHQVVSWSIQPFGHNRHGPKSGGCCAPFWGSWVPISYNVASAKAYLRTKWHLDPPSRLATTDIDRKFGGCVPLEGSWVLI